MATSITRKPVEYVLVRDKEGKQDPYAGQNALDADRTPAHIHWRPLVMMSLFFVLGSGLAVGHHFFYAHWNGRDIATTLSQAWITRIGTAFAFLVKVFLVLTAGIAYVQQLWSSLSSRPMKVKRVNSAFNVLGDVTSFTDAGLWLHNPILLLPALITWLIPLAAVITPGTLAIVVLNSESSKPVLVPQPQYNYTAYSIYAPAGGVGFEGATTELSSLVTATAVGSSILQLPSNHPNISYTMDFLGPAIQCQEAEASYQAIVSKALDQWSIQNGYEDVMAFAAWVPGDFNYAPSPGNVTFPFYTNPAFSTWDSTSTDVMRIFVLGQWNIKVWDSAPENGGHKLLECRLKNASYTVFFNFTYPSQALELRSLTYLNDVNGLDIDFNDLQGNETLSNQLAYKGFMQAFGRLLVGDALTSHYGFTSTSFSTWDLLSVDWSSADTTAQQLEQISHNITLSLMSSDTFTLNPNQTIPISATLSNFINVFSYNAADLWLAYGCAILCAALCALIGFSAAHRNGATYSNNFSTIVRTTRNQSMNGIVNESESDGAEPIPMTMAESFVALQRDRSTYNTYGGFRRTSPPH